MQSVRSADGTKIAVDAVGSGPSLIVVLGAFCDRMTGRGLAELLSGDLNVITYDRRGRGDSGDTPPYRIERELEDLDAVIHTVGGAPFVYGHSSGAVLALEAAASGLAISKLAVYEPPYIVDDTRTRPVALTERVSAAVAAGDRSEAMKLFLAEGPGIPAAVIAAMQAGPGWAPMQAIAHTLPYDLTLCGDQLPPLDRLAKIAVPTLALSGGASPEWARNSVAAVADAIAGAEHASLEGQTHGVADDVLAPVLTKFFLP